MEPDLAAASIQAALNRDWKKAVSLNLLFLKQNPSDVDALNRLGRAYIEIGHNTKAADTYQKVLRLDKFNPIATKNLGLLKTSSRLTRLPARSTPSASQDLTPLFLEEPGVTKTVSLIRLGDPKIVSRLHPGDPIAIVPRQHIVSVVNSANQYLGRLPDDLTSRLLPLLRSGNKYQAWVKSIADGLKIFIRELSRSSKHSLTPSFPATEKLSYAAFTPPELIHTEKPDVSETEDQEEFSPVDSEPDQESSS